MVACVDAELGKPPHATLQMQHLAKTRQDMTRYEYVLTPAGMNEYKKRANDLRPLSLGN